MVVLKDHFAYVGGFNGMSFACSKHVGIFIIILGMAGRFTLHASLFGNIVLQFISYIVLMVIN